MRAAAVATLLVSAAMIGSCGQGEGFRPDEIVARERGALDRWVKGDPRGYLEIMDEEVTYFDPYQERRVDGIAAMRKLLEPITGRIKIDRYEMINPKAQQYGQVAVLTFNLVNYVRRPDGVESVLNRWNSTEVYRRVGRSWRLVHSHWSCVTPGAKPAS